MTFFKEINWRRVATEVFGLSGLGLIGFGLFLYAPWVSFTVVGSILFLTAFAATIWGNR